MLIPDVNILVYAYDTSSQMHQEARKWWEATLSQGLPVGLPWASLLGFIRIMTHRSILNNPAPLSDVLQRVGAWLGRPHVQIIHPGERHAGILFDLLVGAGVAGNL